MSTNTVPLEILLVEDERFHQTMAKKYLDKGGVVYNLNLAADGEEALDFLRHRGNHSGAVRPDLILLDLGLPKLSGADVFREIKQDTNLSKIPVIVLTGCDPDAVPIDYGDIPRNCCFTKWMDMKDFTPMIRTVQEYKAKFSTRAA